MANADAAFGFVPVNIDGSAYSGSTIRCYIPAADGTATFIGDAVKLDGDSLAEGGGTSVIQAAAGDPVFGVVTAFEADPATSLDNQYRVASTLRYCQVALAGEGKYFMVQDDGTLGLVGSGLNADFVVGSGSTVTGLSAMEIDSTSEATTATLDLQLVAPASHADNDPTIANANWIVQFNDAQSKAGRTGID